MRDINLNSGIVYLVDDIPQNTKKLMFLYDDRGWAMRCYDADGNKLDTLVNDKRFGTTGVDIHFVSQKDEQLQDS